MDEKLTLLRVAINTNTGNWSLEVEEPTGVRIKSSRKKAKNYLLEKLGGKLDSLEVLSLH